MKTKPISVRFDEEKMTFVMKKQNLPTAQKIVDFFLDEYWWRYHNKWVTSENNIPHTNNQQHTQLQIQKPETFTVDQYSAYETELRNAQMVSQLEIIMREVKKDNSLSPQQKFKLEQFAKKIGAEIDF